MTNEEALQSVLVYCVEACGKICSGKDKECAEATIIKALEKQIAKKPKSSLGTGWPYECTCGEYIEFQDKYCCICGQAIDWSDADGI